MAFQGKWDVYKVTEWKGNAVYRTKKVTTIWLDIKPRTTAEQNAIAKEYGGDQLAATVETRFV